MIIWRGWGILALLVAAAGGGLGTGLGVLLGGATDHANIGTGLGLLAAGAAIWVLGTRMNAPRPGFHPATGQPVVYRNRHSLFFVPLQFWGPIVALGGVVAFVIALTT